MATLVLGLAGQAIGQAIVGPTAFSLFGATLSGAAIGGAIGASLGNLVDSRLIGGRTIHREGPRLAEISLQASQEGAAIPRLYGRARIAGQIIWAARFLETKTTRTQKVGGKGGGGQRVTESDYAYSLSFAVGLCEGKIAGIGRVWADGKPLDASGITLRVHTGTDDQEADAVIEAVEGAGNAPAYKGLAYVVFEDLALEQFGNRVPQLQFEVFRPLEGDDPESLEKLAQAVALGPGTGEFVLATEPVFRDLGGGNSAPENMNNATGQADFLVSLDQLTALLPNVSAVTLVVCWFGSDLRCGSCAIKPGVEEVDKTTYPLTWQVDGVARASAHLVSRDINDRPNFGGTPSDAAVLQAIVALQERGIQVYLYPFLMMDIPAGNALTDPYGGAEQAAFPWRGRITCTPAPGQVSSPYGTSTAATQVTAFFGSASPGNFAVNTSAGTVSYTGGADWGYRRFILHYAHLAALGGANGFFIGSEMKALTQVRGASMSYPAVAALKTLAADVRGILGSGVKISYAADWSEYFGHQPQDGSHDAIFHLDPLWSDANIDAVAIDLYHPLSDWRDGKTHLDYLAGARNIHDRDYLKSNVETGEGFDWYYADATARDAQTRTAITDSVYGKPWVFRYKDIRNWWLNNHYDRPGGVQSASHTAWVPQSKAIWFSEVGVPALDKGANEPNVFYDPKSSESALPYYSNGERDDLMQRRALEATLGYWRDSAGNNPNATGYSGRMIDTSRVFLWTWDARPYPDFPIRENVWSDGANWRFGHFLNGRMGAVPLGELVSDLCGSASDLVDSSALAGLVTGYMLDAPMAARSAIEPLASAYHFDAVESEGVIRFQARADAEETSLTPDDLAASDTGDSYSLTRAQESDLPASARISYAEVDAEYRIAAVESKKLSGVSERTVDVVSPIVMMQSEAQSLADLLLQASWAGRESAKFKLPPSSAALEPGDILNFETDTRSFQLQITRINDGEEREIEAVSIDKSVFDAPPGPQRLGSVGSLTTYGRGEIYFLDLPLLPGWSDGEAGYIAIGASPWPGKEALYKSGKLQTVLRRPAIAGELLSPLYAGPNRSLGPWQHDLGGSAFRRCRFGGRP